MGEAVASSRKRGRWKGGGEREMEREYCSLTYNYSSTGLL